MKRASSFTLIELLIASSILVILMVTVYSGFRTGIFSYRNIEETLDATQAARQILERLNSDLRNSFAYSDNETGFAGTGKEVAFLTLVDTFKDDLPTRDYAFISYRMEGDKLMRVCRKDKEALNTRSEISPQEMASGLEITFTYFKPSSTDSSLEEKDSWNVGNSQEEKQKLPAAVKVKLTLKGKNRQEFERKIFLSLPGKTEIK
jgi:prepilin-type N-terminal cleavage/methylation domain-containing protein